MSFRILTKNSVENTNIDGARDCNFNSGRRSGIVKGALNEGKFFAMSSNVIALDTCELRLCGHRIVVDELEYKTLSNIPASPVRYSLIAQVIVDDNKNVEFNLFIQSASTPLIQNNLDQTGVGTYQLEIGRFTQLTSGQITDVIRTADLITGGSSNGTIQWNVGNIKTTTLNAGLPANVDIDYNEETNAYDFQFDIPQGADGQGQTNVKVNDVIQTEINFKSDPQTQIDKNATDISGLENTTINGQSLEQNITLYGSNITLASDNEGTLTDAIINANIRIDALETSLLNKTYPVGAIYISTSQTSPASLLGGSWEQIKDKFLLSSGDSYLAGTTGGEASHTLTIDEMPAHRHSLYSSKGYSSDSVGIGNINGKFIGCTFNGTGQYYDTTKTGETCLSNAGGGQAHNNMPPYLVVYMWKRTA